MLSILEVKSTEDTPDETVWVCIWTKPPPGAAWKSEAVAEVAVQTWSALAVSDLLIALLFNVVIAFY